jgi:hypothetical protein
MSYPKFYNCLINFRTSPNWSGHGCRLYALLTASENIVDSPYGRDSSPWTEGREDWSSSGSSVDDEKSSPSRRADVHVLPDPWLAREGEERARLVRALPLRAEDEILRVRCSRLKKRVAELEAREAQRLSSETKVTPRSRRPSGNGEPIGSKRWKSSEDVWFTTLAEVSVNPATPASGGGEDDGLDRLIEKLFVEALEDDGGGSEVFGWERRGRRSGI